MRHLLIALVSSIALSGATAAQDSARPVRIGFLTDLNGPYTANDGKSSIAAARMAIADFGGKVLGRPVELIVGDHQNKVDVGVAVARRWYETGDVDAIMDVNNSGIALAVSRLTQEKNRVLLVTAAASVEITGKSCSPNTVHWLPDTYSLAHNVATVETLAGAKSWYFIAVDYALGRSMLEEATKAIEENGGKVVGAVRHPVGTADFSSYILQAQNSGALTLGLANVSDDFITTIKQAREFGTKMRLAAIVLYLLDVSSVGQREMAGLHFVDAFYWDMTEKTRAWSKRFNEVTGHMPTTPQANAYQAVIHYLRAIEKAGTDEAGPVMKAMKALPLDDATGSAGYVRADGRVIRDMYLFEVKDPAESKYDWDYYKVVKTLSGETAYLPPSKSQCPLLSQSSSAVQLQ